MKDGKDGSKITVKKRYMKRTIAILLAAIGLTACYEDYVKDYEYNGVYIAYQYDLRTFVIGEGMKFDVGVVLGGVIDNQKDRNVNVVIDDELVTGDLSGFGDSDDVKTFVSIDGMLGNAPLGDLSQAYVTNEIKSAGIKALKPLPKSYYTISREDLTIKKGSHTATMTIRANKNAFLSDFATIKPYYAIGYRIVDADADMILKPKSFSVVAVKYEHMLYGNYWHGGVTTVRNSAGETVSEDVYKTEIPEMEQRVYTLATKSPNSLTTNRMGNGEGSLLLKINDDGSIDVSCGDKDIQPDGEGSRFNQAKLLQNRKLFLNYKYENGDGTVTHVKDTLTFRNRIRDGINEWQDENPENYK